MRQRISTFISPSIPLDISCDAVSVLSKTLAVRFMFALWGMRFPHSTSCHRAVYLLQPAIGVAGGVEKSWQSGSGRAKQSASRSMATLPEVDAMSSQSAERKWGLGVR